LVTNQNKQNQWQIKLQKNKTIVLPINETIYEDFLGKRSFAHELIQDVYEVERNLFPIEMVNKK